MRRNLTHVSWLIFAVGAGIPVIFINRYALNVPYSDQWNLIGLLSQGWPWEIAFDQLISFHADHRLFFPRWVILSLAKLTNWNIRAEAFAVWVIATASGTIILKRAMQKWDSVRSYPLFIGTIIGMTLAWTSLSQWENFLWTWSGLQWHLTVFGAVIAFAALDLVTRQRSIHARVIWLSAAVAGALVSQYSSANGVLVWLLGLIFFFPARQQFSLALLWVGVGGISTFYYLDGYRQPDNHPSLYYGIEHLAIWIRQVGDVLGGLAPRGAVAFAFGIVQLIGFLMFCFWQIRRRRSRRTELSLFWIALGLYAVLSAGLIATARAGYSDGYGDASRFVLFSAILAVVNLKLLYEEGLRRARPVMGFAILSAIIVLVIAGDFYNLGKQRRWTQQLTLAGECLRQFQTAGDDCLALLSIPGAYRVREQAAILQQMGYSVFSKP